MHADTDAQDPEPMCVSGGPGRRSASGGQALCATIDSFSYASGGRPALCGVDLELLPGELVVVAGPSGSGKSTLGLALAGLIPQRVEGTFHGSVAIRTEHGERIELTELELHEAAQHVGITFQNPEYQLIQYQVDAEVAFGPENLGLPHAEVVARVHQALAAVNAEGLARRAISSLSGGQKQRVAIAAALAMAPPMLILDEPTSDLDPVGTDEVLQVLHHLSHVRGHGVVVVEHKLDEIAPYADRVLLVVDGQVVVDDHPRRAFVPTARWHAAGVRPPELVALAERLPDRFGECIPLSVTEALASLGDATPAPFRASVGRPIGPRADEPALAAHGITVSFNGACAVSRASLRVEQGEWVALIGANGSGKTTLGASLMGFITPEEGTASCFGRPVEFGRIPSQADRLGYLFQNVDDMLFGSTVAAELEFTTRHRVPSGRDAPTAAEVATLIGLADRLDAHPHMLSGGERQRLALGALLTRAPRGLILDEPTTGLDEVHAAALFELLARVRTSLGSLTCLLITHDMRLVARFADRVIVMRRGEIVLESSPRHAFAEEALLESCGVRPPTISSLHRRTTPTANTVAVDAAEFAELLHRSGSQKGLNVGFR